MSVMERFIGPADEDQQHVLCFDISQIIRPLVDERSSDPSLSSSKRKARASIFAGAAEGAGFELFDRLCDAFVDPVSAKRLSVAFSPSMMARSPSSVDLQQSEQSSETTGDEASIFPEGEEEEFDVSLLQIVPMDDSFFDKFHNDVKQSVIAYLRKKLEDFE